MPEFGRTSATGLRGLVGVGVYQPRLLFHLKPRSRLLKQHRGDRLPRLRGLPGCPWLARAYRQGRCHLWPPGTCWSFDGWGLARAAKRGPAVPLTRNRRSGRYKRPVLKGLGRHRSSFGGQRSIQLSYGCVTVHLADWRGRGNGPGGGFWEGKQRFPGPKSSSCPVD